MGDAWKTFGITLIVLLALISAILIAAYLSRECNTNLDCVEDEYCAFNHKCISYPSRNVTVDLLPAAFIIGLSLIICALILRGYLPLKKKR